MTLCWAVLRCSNSRQAGDLKRQLTQGLSRRAAAEQCTALRGKLAHCFEGTIGTRHKAVDELIAERIVMRHNMGDLRCLMLPSMEFACGTRRPAPVRRSC